MISKEYAMSDEFKSCKYDKVVLSLNDYVAMGYTETYQKGWGSFGSFPLALAKLDGSILNINKAINLKYFENQDEVIIKWSDGADDAWWTLGTWNKEKFVVDKENRSIAILEGVND